MIVIERIVIRLDAVAENLPAIEAAARLAARAKAPLHGVFIEDEELLSLAGLPFAHQVTLHAGAERFTKADAELHLQAAAARARREVEAAAMRHRVESSFALVRGGSDSVLSTISERDLVVAGALTRPVAGQFRAEGRWWRALDDAPGPFLMVRRAGEASGGIVLLLRDRGAASARLVDTAAQIADAAHGSLTVLMSPAVADMKGIRKWLGDRLAGLGIRLQIEVAPAEPAELHRRIDELQSRLLAVEAGIVEGGGDRLRQFVGRFACDVLIVR